MIERIKDMLRKLLGVHSPSKEWIYIYVDKEKWDACTHKKTTRK